MSVCCTLHVCTMFVFYSSLFQPLDESDCLELARAMLVNCELPESDFEAVFDTVVLNCHWSKEVSWFKVLERFAEIYSGQKKYEKYTGGPSYAGLA